MGSRRCEPPRRSRAPGRAAALAGGLFLAFWAGAAQAQIDWGRAVATLEAAGTPDSALPRALISASGGDVPLLLERRASGATLPRGAIAVVGDWFAVRASESQARLLPALVQGVSLQWSAPRRLLLDRADGFVSASAFRNSTGLSGQGAVVGLVDSGIDLSHPAFMDEAGRTRVRWLIDLSRPPAGRNPELESEYGCDADFECAIYEASDLEEVMHNSVSGDEPRDLLGHGTHVASIAAGNGGPDDPPRFVGVAPDADLIVARVTRSRDGSVEDGDVLLATRFVFERAEELGAPAVVNLSLGGDFGPHDGTSALERALGAMVGPDLPGRAIVVAAGNSAGLYQASGSSYPQPLGIHTEVHVPRGAEVRVPLLTPLDAPVTGSVYVWLGFRQGDDLELGLDHNQRSWLDLVASGKARHGWRGDLEGTVFNGVTDEAGSVAHGQPAAAVLLEGSWSPSDRIEIVLKGAGTAAIWVQGAGGLDPTLSLGPLLPQATKESTINLPAAHPGLIAVGATLNRTEWQDHEGELIQHPAHGALTDAPPDTTAYFSSAGPNSLGTVKPDLVAPGANVIAAMARLADPRASVALGMFSSAGRCEGATECYVVDDHYAVSSGTSMAAPLVSGAIALLFQADPELSQPEVLTLLQAGARVPGGEIFLEQQIGLGELDLGGTLEAMHEQERPSALLPAAPGTQILAAASYAHPDPGWPLSLFVKLRDESGRLADGFDERRLEVRVRGARLAEPLSRVAPGLRRLAVVADRRTGGSSISVDLLFDGERVAEKTIPIAVDLGAASGAVGARGGCSIAGAFPRWPGPWGAVLVGLLLLGRGRRARRVHRRR